jgi:hypothetical protein
VGAPVKVLLGYWIGIYGLQCLSANPPAGVKQGKIALTTSAARSRAFARVPDRARAGTERSSARFVSMNEPLPLLMENSIQIAWDYLEAIGELGDGHVAARFLMDSVEMMIRRGERRKLLLSNRAIDAYLKFKAEGRSLALVS